MDTSLMRSRKKVNWFQLRHIKIKEIWSGQFKYYRNIKSITIIWDSLVDMSQDRLATWQILPDQEMTFTFYVSRNHLHLSWLLILLYRFCNSFYSWYSFHLSFFPNWVWSSLILSFIASLVRMMRQL